MEHRPKTENTQININWQSLSTNEKAFVVSYIENSYSLESVSGDLGVSVLALRKLLSRSDIRKAISEVQAEQAEITFLNEKWVKTQLLKLYPKVVGEEDVPFINGNGDEMMIRRFYPDIAMRVIEYVVPKDSKKEEEAVAKFSFNVTLAKEE
jgi:phosphoribosylaminoimidazole carboxylase (NCAIR synthetase)